MQNRNKVNYTKNRNKAMINVRKTRAFVIYYISKFFFFLLFLSWWVAQVLRYLHGRGLRSVPADVVEGAVGVFLRVVGAWLAERIWRLGDSFSATPGPTDWERAKHANGWRDVVCFFCFWGFVSFWYCVSDFS